MRWMLNLDGGPRRVNHAAVAMGDKIYSFGGYSANEAVDSQGDFIDVHMLNTFTYRWERLPVLPESDTAKTVRALAKQRSVTISNPEGGPSTSSGTNEQNTNRRRARSLSDLHPLAQIRATNPPLDDVIVVPAQPQQLIPSPSSTLTGLVDNLIHRLGQRQLQQQQQQRSQQQPQRPVVRARTIEEEEEEAEVDGENGGQQQQQTVGRHGRPVNARQQIRELFQRIDDDLAEMGSDESDEAYEGDEEDEDNSVVSEDTDYMDTEEEQAETASDVDMAEEELGPDQSDDDDDANPVADLVLLARLHRNPEIPFKRYGHTVVVYQKFIYLWGGRNDKLGCNQTLHRYDPAENRWSIVPTEGQCPPARDGHTAVVEGDHMYVFGGFEEKEHRFSQETYALHFPSRTWTKLRTQGEPPQYRDFHAACILNGKMYVFGGRSDEMGQLHTSHDVYCNKLYYLDLKTHKWHQPELAPANKGRVQPCGRRSHTMWSYDGALYLFGGYQSIRNVHFNDLWRYDIDSSTWTLLKPSGQGPSARRRQCTIVVGSRVFLFGGTMPSVGRRNTLADLGDLHVLDFEPSLASLCSQAVLQYGLQAHATYILPTILLKELHYMSTPNCITKSHMLALDDMIRG